MWLVSAFLLLFSLLARLLGPVLPMLKSLDYLLKVSQTEHYFDNALFRHDFPEIGNKEETILQCFTRIKKRRLAEKTRVKFDPQISLKK